MRNFQKLCAAVTLIFVLSLPALAGEITTMAVPPPPPPSASAIVTEPNDIGSDEIQSPSESDRLITEVTLTILQLLSVF
jgi:hypothetical protein